MAARHRGAAFGGALVAAVTALAVSACAGPGTTQPGGLGTGDAPLSFGAPVRVGPAPTRPAIGTRRSVQLPATLAGSTAYLLDPGVLRLVDATTGQELSRIAPQHRVLDTEGSSAAPVLATLHGALTVIAPFIVQGPALELVKVDTGTRAATHTLVTLPGWTGGTVYNLAVRAVGTAQGILVLNLTGGLYHGVLAVDAATGQTRWYADGVTAGAVTGDTVSAVRPDGAPSDTDQVVGLDVSTGRQRWAQLRGLGLQVLPAGPRLVAAAGQLPGRSGQTTFQLLTAATGARASSLPLNGALPARCLYDQLKTVVCTAPTDDEGGARTAVGVDAVTGRQLWRLPDSNTGTDAVPTATAAWGGLLYARTADGRTEIFRAATGSPVHTTPGPSPYLLDRQAGLSLSNLDGTLVAVKPGPDPRNP
jgi:outer membrane protein assembly factor BamB